MPNSPFKLQINAISSDPNSVPANVITDVADIVRSKSQALEVNEQGTRIRRKIVSALDICLGALDCLGARGTCYLSCVSVSTAVC